MDMEERYSRNRGALSAEEQRQLADASVLVLGCGGLGGYVIELLARIGVGRIAAADGDVFCISNLNRQLLCTEETLGMNKALVAEARVRAVNSAVSFEAFPYAVTEENVGALLSGRHAAVDCLDNPESRLLCARAAQLAGIPFVHGAISGWSLRVHTLLPGDGIMELLCAPGAGAEKLQGNLPFTASVCAGMLAAETVKLLLGRGRSSSRCLIEADLHELRFDEIGLE